MPNDLTQFLRVGQQALIHLGAGAADHWRSSTTIRGWVADVSLLLDTPVLQGAPVSLERGSPCTTRCLVEGTAVGFTSVVADANRTQPIFRITWPTKVEYVAIRKHERMKLNASCVLRDSSDISTDAELRDLSLGGCRIFAPRSIRAGSQVDVSMHLFSGRDLGPVPTVVRNETPVADGFLLGCQFTGMDAVTRLEIECFLSAQPDAVRFQKKNSSRAVIIGRDPDFIEAMRTLLRPLECEVVAAASAVDGFHAMRMATTHVVLAQSDLPELAGADICRVARAALGLENLQFVLFGGKPADEATAKAAGAFRFFPAGAPHFAISQSVHEALEAGHS